MEGILGENSVIFLIKLAGNFYEVDLKIFAALVVNLLTKYFILKCTKYVKM